MAIIQTAVLQAVTDQVPAGTSDQFVNTADPLVFDFSQQHNKGINIRSMALTMALQGLSTGDAFPINECYVLADMFDVNGQPITFGQGDVNTVNPTGIQQVKFADSVRIQDQIDFVYPLNGVYKIEVPVFAARYQSVPATTYQLVMNLFLFYEAP